MSKRHDFKQLAIYTRSLKLAENIINFVDEVRPYRLGEQLAGSSISIPSNIAEGAERGTNKEFHRFLEYSSGSAAELFTQLTIIDRTGKYKQHPINLWIKECDELNAMIRGFMIKIKNDPT